MQAQDEAIELLEDINTINLYALATWLDIKYKDDPVPQVQTDLRKWSNNIDQALAKLKEEPEQGEFTKNIMANLGGAYRDTIVAWLKELCRRYDWLVKTISQLRRQKTSIISQLNQQIDQLQAEIKKLIEGQQAKKEAGS